MIISAIRWRGISHDGCDSHITCRLDCRRVLQAVEGNGQCRLRCDVCGRREGNQITELSLAEWIVQGSLVNGGGRCASDGRSCYRCGADRALAEAAWEMDMDTSLDVGCATSSCGARNFILDCEFKCVGCCLLDDEASCSDFDASEGATSVGASWDRKC